MLVKLSGFHKILSTPLPLPRENKMLQNVGKWIKVPKNNMPILIRDCNTKISKEEKIRTWICEIAAICKATHTRK